MSGGHGDLFIFLFLDRQDGFSLSVKLPVSRDFALLFDFAEPAGYGLTFVTLNLFQGPCLRLISMTVADWSA